MLSEGRQGQSIRVLATATALALVLAVPGGCASDGDGDATASGSEESYPNLGDVPERPATMTEEQREQLERGLVADSQQREYSEEVIAFQADPAEPLPAPMETGAGGAPGSSLGDVTMPAAVTPPFSGSPGAPTTASDAAPSAVPKTSTAATAATTAATAATTGATDTAATGASAASAATGVTAASAATGVTAASAASAAAAAQATAPNIPMPPDDPMARATTPPFSGATGSMPTPLAAPSAARSAAPSYTPVPDAPTAPAGDGSTSDLNRAQLDSLRPTPPPFSGATAGVAASSAPTPLTAAPPVASAPGSSPSATTSAYAAPPATPAYAPPPATPAYAPPPADVQEVFEARLQDTLPTAPLAPLPSTGDLGGDEPLTTVVVSSSGVATFEELPVNVPVLEREPVPAVAVGGQRGSLARKAVPGDSVKVATILFGDGSAELRDREREIVREVYQRYLANGRKVRVVGHSSSRTRNMDPVRHRMVNFGISAERANAVAEELQRLGVPSERITVVAAADDMPVYYEVMPSGEAGNRRTEIYLD